MFDKNDKKVIKIRTSGILLLKTFRRRAIIDKVRQKRNIAGTESGRIMKSYGKRGKIRWLAVLLAAGSLSLTAYAEENTFVQGTTVNGLGISEMTVEEAGDHIRDFYSREYSLTIKERNNMTETIQGKDIGFAIGLPEGSLAEILERENAAGRAFGPDAGNSYRIRLQNSYDQGALESEIQSLGCISGSSIVTTEDAHVSGYEEGKPFTIVPEVRGNNVDPEKVAQTVRDAVAAGDREVDLEAAGCYVPVKVTAGDESLKNLCDTMNRCREMEITYTFGEESEVVDAPTICSWLTGTANGEIQLDTEKVAAYVAELAGRRDTAGTARSFRAADGRETTVSGAYGWKIDQAAEQEALILAVRAGESQSREPLYASAAALHGESEWGQTYVEVDLTNQHVYMKKDGAIVWDAPCVTGNESRGHDTPAGIYTLAYKQRDRVLRGARRADGSYEYESPVSYWMPFNGGIGLHDANWRGSFGGTIYKTNGSHGCVNLPPQKTAALYELVYQGIPVICYH